MLDVILDTLLDSLKLLPFLFLTYLLMEWLEHRAGDKAKHFLERSGTFGPLLGSLLGAVPQCGFSASAAGLYAGGVITAGTLMAVFLSTSDEMLPILISHEASPLLILKILGIKVAVGVLVGFLTDFVLRLTRRADSANSEKEHDHDHIGELCEEDHCHCENGILRSALHHTLQIFVFILVISFLLNLVVFLVGEDKLAAFLSSVPGLSQALSGLVGLIPNCAASVVITEMYLEGILSTGSMLSGLLVGAGIGLLVLFRVNHKHLKDNLAFTVILYGAGVLTGILTDALGLVL